MTEPREPQAETAADPGLEVSPEMIQDLDVTDDGADKVADGPDGPDSQLNHDLEGKPIHKAWPGNPEFPPPPSAL
jgi:hypothetical protein